MRKLHTVAFILLIIGGLNWGLYAFGYDIGQWVPENVMMVVYVLIGLAALSEAIGHKSFCRNCNPGSMGGGMNM